VPEWHLLDRIRDPWLRALSILLVLIAGLYLAGMVWSLLVQLADILVLFFFGWLVAFMLEPAVALAQERYGVPRGAAVSGVYVGLLAILVAIAFWLVPTLVTQLVVIAQQWPLYVENVTYYANWVQHEATARGLVLNPEIWSDYLDLVRRFAGLGPPLVANVLNFARSATAVAMDAVIVFVLSVYLTLDSQRITYAAVRAVPPHMRDDFLYFLDSVRRAFGGFVRGQLILSALYGIGTALVMSAAGLDFTLLASVFAALAMLIPFLGQVLAVLPPAIIALLIHPEHLWWVVVLLVLLQVVILNVVSPRVMGHTVGMHPLLVFMSVLVGAKLAGVWGAVFGVPIAGVAVAMIGFYRLTLAERQLRTAPLSQNNGALGAGEGAEADVRAPAAPR
jgi:predicted PurR-regulated permease PerM